MAAAMLALAGWGGVAVPAGAQLAWSEREPLPEPSGLAGAHVGVAGGRLVVAGGVSGDDARSDRVLVLGPGGTNRADGADGAWRLAGTLPSPRAHGTTVADGDALLLLGGDDGVAALDEVLRLEWGDVSRTSSTPAASDGPDGSGPALAVSRLPPLPGPSVSGVGGRVGDVLWLLPGRADPRGEVLHDALWSLDLSDGAARWRRHPGCPGGPRARAAAAVSAFGDGRAALCVFGGEDPARGVLRDAWAWVPADEAWVRLADLPAPRAGAPAVSLGPSHVLLLPGDDGTARAPQPVLAYHLLTDTWADLGPAPAAAVDTGAAAWDARVVVPGGETRPGERTSAVHALEVLRPAASLEALDLGVLLAYLAALVVLGVVCARRNVGTEDYFLAGRRVPWWAAGLSICGTQLSAITFLATPALAYATDLRYAPTWIVILAMAPVVVVFYLPFFRRLQVTTAYEYLERRFSPSVRLLGSGAFIAFQLARMSILVYLPALALATVTGQPVETCILVLGLLATVYTVLGGMEAVVWTDVLQVGVLLGGVVCALVLVVGDLGGWSAMTALADAGGRLVLWDGGFRWTSEASWSLLIGAFFLQFGPYTTDQAVIQRYLSTKDEAAAARAVWLNGFLAIPAALTFPVLGTALYAFYRSRPGSLAVGMAHDEVFPLFIGQRLPAGIAGLVIAGLLAASMSSLDSSMHGIATAVTNDFDRRLRPGLGDRARLRFARAVTVVVGILGTAAALTLAQWDIRSLFLFFQKAVGLLSSGLAGVFLLGISTRRVGTAAALLGAGVSTALLVWVTWWTPLHTFWSAAVGIGACVLTGLVAARVRPAPPADPTLVWSRRRSDDEG